MNKTNREIILDALRQINDNGAYSHETIGSMFIKYNVSEQDRVFITRIIKGTLTYQIRIDYIISQFSSVKINKMKPIILNTLRMSIYQMLFCDYIETYAIINEAVNIIKKSPLKNLSGFVNAILRNVDRNRDKIDYPDKNTDYNNYLHIYYSIPLWIIEMLSKQYSKEIVENILHYYNKEPKLFIRVNESKISVNELTSLFSPDIQFEKSTLLPYAIKFNKIENISSIPGYNEGLFAIQDISSQLVGEVLKFKNNMKILDLCCSPGGKSLHIIDKLYKEFNTETNFEIYMCDKSKNRLDLIKHNLERFKLDHLPNIHVVENDATVFNKDFEDKFDLVLVDAPCSGFGTLGRKSDLRLKREKDNITALSKIQREIIDVAKKYVKQNGNLIYSTCTILKEENQENANYILSLNDFVASPIDKELRDRIKEYDSDTIITENEILIIPGKSDIDGFYISSFTKK